MLTHSSMLRYNLSKCAQLWGNKTVKDRHVHEHFIHERQMSTRLCIFTGLRNFNFENIREDFNEMIYESLTE